ncbi:hypothetical protein DFH09DRAFT_1110314 [Mycena vulgaris]|nr:hypothetical protein DFH09DRAFT_1110314 [Mycena vulgaris]
MPSVGSDSCSANRLMTWNSEIRSFVYNCGLIRSLGRYCMLILVGLPVGPDAELPEIAADMVPGYFYGMWVSIQRVNKAVGEEARKRTTTTQRFFIGRRASMRHTGWLFGEIDFVRILGGLLRESWFQSTLDIPVGAEENTFLLYVMAPSAGIHRYLTHTFKVADVINRTATRQRADTLDDSIKTIERCYSRLSSSIPAREHIAHWDQFSKDVSGDNFDETRRLDGRRIYKMIPTVELIKTGDSDGRQNPSRSYTVSFQPTLNFHGLNQFLRMPLGQRHYIIALQQANNHKPLPFFGPPKGLSEGRRNYAIQYRGETYLQPSARVVQGGPYGIGDTCFLGGILTGSLEETAWGQAASEHEHI